MKIALALAAATLGLATAAQAQDAESQSEAARAALNSQQAATAQRQLDRNAASQRRHDMAEAARDQAIRDNDAAYDAALHEHRLDVEEYHRAMREWRGDVAACNAGDRSRCAAPEPQR